MKILKVSQVQTLERSSNDYGHTYRMMMECAGGGVAEVVKSRVTSLDSRILVLVGPGNNGGDGLVAARVLQRAQFPVTVYLSRNRNAETDEVYYQAVESGVCVLDAAQDKAYDALRKAVLHASVIIDALLGTGSKPPLHGSIKSILEVVREILQHKPQMPVIHLQPDAKGDVMSPLIVAVDGPSGLDFDTGEVDPLTPSVDVTVTFATPKWGHLKSPGMNRIGELVVIDIGIPEHISLEEKYNMTTPSDIIGWLPVRPPDAHKGTFGRVMIVAGSSNYTGAAILSAKGALRAGAGLVTLALPGSLHTAVVSAIPEATYVLLPQTMGVVNEQAATIVNQHLKGYKALLIGPGLGNTPESLTFMRALLQANDKKMRLGFISSNDSHEKIKTDLPPLIIDADGLNVLAKIPDWQHLLPSLSILTPHPGEMARLTGLSTDDIISNRFDQALQWAQEWHHIVVLKGAHTVIANPEGEAFVLPFANPGLSTAGTGDVLAGAIASMLAQSCPPFQAAVIGAYIHGLAGEICRRTFGTAGILAGDVANSLATALKYFE